MKVSFVTLTLLVSAALLPGQTPAPKKTAPAATAVTKAAVVTNFKETGSPSAPITLEVYTDYECPSCRSLYMQTLPEVQKEYIATGKVRMIHRDFPLPQHQFSRLAAKFANASGQIGKYDIVAEQIFKTQPEWSQNGNVEGAVAKVLSNAELDKVKDIMKTDVHLDDTVTADVAMGTKDRLDQTPTMEVVYKGSRQKVAGFVPFNILKQYLDQLLTK